MAAHERVLNALNFLTGEGVAYYPDGCDAQEGRSIEALITDYFSNGNDVSEDESDRSDNDTSSDDEIADTSHVQSNNTLSTDAQDNHEGISTNTYCKIQKILYTDTQLMLQDQSFNEDYDTGIVFKCIDYILESTITFDRNYRGCSLS